jgi:hypothetical protein
MDILIILLLGALLVFIVYSFNQKRVPPNTITAFTGGLGSGKTFMAVRFALKAHRSNMIHYYLERLLPFKKKFKKKPQFYSNIPIRVWFNQWARTLTYEHLTLTSRLEEYSTIVIDEIGHFASQYEYDHPFVQQYLQEFIRFFRHYIDGKLFITDQSSSNIVVSIRRRINQIYNLSNFSRVFLLFYKINVSEIHITEDILNIQQSTLHEKEIPYFFGFLPFKFMRLFGLKPRYDSRCYSENYKALFSFDIIKWNTYKTDYFIELPNSPEMRSLYKRFGYLTQEQTADVLKKWKTRNSTEKPNQNEE